MVLLCYIGVTLHFNTTSLIRENKHIIHSNDIYIYCIIYIQTNIKTRMKKYIVFLIATLFCIEGFAQDEKKSKEELWNQIQTEVTENKSFKVEVTQATPFRGRTIHPSSIYSIEVRNDSLYSYLPYYGRATNIAYGGGDGLTFDAKLKSYKIDKVKDNRISLTLKADSSDDYYRYIITIFSNGSVSFDVIGVNRESISFLGDYISNQKEDSK